MNENTAAFCSIITTSNGNPIGPTSSGCSMGRAVGESEGEGVVVDELEVDFIGEDLLGGESVGEDPLGELKFSFSRSLITSSTIASMEITISKHIRTVHRRIRACFA